MSGKTESTRQKQSYAESITEFMLLGQAMYYAQHVEFGLYMIASHLSSTEAAQSDKRLKNLDPDAFINGDPESFKVTLGQLVDVFGDHLMLSTPDFLKFRDDRNTIAHNYYRRTSDKFQGSKPLVNKLKFLKDFIDRAVAYSEMIGGLITIIINGKIQAAGFGDMISNDEATFANMKAYVEHTERYKAHKNGGNPPA